MLPSLFSVSYPPKFTKFRRKNPNPFTATYKKAGDRLVSRLLHPETKKSGRLLRLIGHRTHANLDLLGFSLCFLAQRNRKNTSVIRSRYRIRRLRQRKAPHEASVPPLDPVEILFLLLSLEFPLTLHGKYLILHAYIQIILLDARNFELQNHLLGILIHIHRRHKATRRQALVFARGVAKVMKNRVQPVLQQRHIAQRRAKRCKSSDRHRNFSQTDSCRRSNRPRYR